MPSPPILPAPPTPEPQADPPDGGLRVPAVLSLLLLVGALAGSVALARAHPGVSAAPRAVQGLAPTLLRDVLTGRPTQGDGAPLAPESGPGSPGLPLQLRFIPSSDQAQAGPAIDHLLEFLRRRTGYALVGKVPRSYALVIEELLQGRCDLAFLTATSYERAYRATLGGAPDDDIRVILSVVRQGNPDYPGSDLAYRGAIVVRKDSDLTSIGQLTGERSMALGSPTSGAGSILPTEQLNALGLRPRIQRYEGYPAILTAVVQKAVDAGAIWWSAPNPENPQNDARINVRELLPDIFETTRILGFTAWIPNEPVVVRAALPAEIRHVLARALALYVATRAASEAGRRELESIGSLLALIPAQDEDFAVLHEVVERAFANDPEGRADFMAGSK